MDVEYALADRSSTGEYNQSLLSEILSLFQTALSFDQGFVISRSGSINYATLETTAGPSGELEWPGATLSAHFKHDRSPRFIHDLRNQEGFTFLSDHIFLSASSLIIFHLDSQGGWQEEQDICLIGIHAQKDYFDESHLLLGEKIARLASKTLHHASRQRELNIEKMLLTQRLNTELSAVSMEAEIASKSNRQFLSNLSQRLRSPLNSIMGMSQLLSQTDLTPQQAGFCSIISQNGNNLIGMINTLPRFSDHEFNKSLESLADRFYPSDFIMNAPAPPITLIDKNVLIITDNELDRVYLTQQLILADMIPHTADSIEEGFQLIKSGIDLDLIILGSEFYDQTPSATIFKLRQTGVHKPLILIRELWQITNSRVENIEIKTITKPFKGQALYMLVNTLLARQDNSLKDQMVVSSNDLAQDAPLKILVVEDSSTTQVHTEDILETFGYHADFASNGEEALSRLRTKRYHLVLMDIQMPVMDGIQATRSIREEFAAEAQPIIYALTLSGHSHAKDAYLDIGIDGVLSKPIQIDDMRQVLVKTGQAFNKTLKNGEQPAIDLHRFQGNLGGIDWFLMLKNVYPAFEADYKTYINQINIGLSEQDRPKVKKGAHALKGVSSTIGAYQMASIALELEQQVENGELNKTQDLIDQLKSEFGRVARAWLAIKDSQRKGAP